MSTAKTTSSNLIDVMGPCIKQQTDPIVESVNELRVITESVLTHLEIIEKLLSGEKKTLKKAPTAKPAAVADDAPAVKKYRDSHAWFAANFKDSADFRAEMFEKLGVDEKTLDEDPVIKGKKNDVQRMNAKVTQVWALVKNKPDLSVEIQTRYNATKETGPKPQQEQPEPATPPTDEVDI